MSDLCQAMSNVSITSLYVPEATDPSSSELSSSDDRGRSANLAIRRVKLNEFLIACDRPIITVQKKPWRQLKELQSQASVYWNRDRYHSLNIGNHKS